MFWRLHWQSKICNKWSSILQKLSTTVYKLSNRRKGPYKVTLTLPYDTIEISDVNCVEIEVGDQNNGEEFIETLIPSFKTSKKRFFGSS